MNRHSAHCRACKERVRDFLAAIYGECQVNRSFAWPAHPDAYVDTPLGNHLQQIRTALGDWRRHRDFIKSAEVPPCDYFISDPPFIVEFDESQHFSRPRSIALANYPGNFPVGFSILRWQQLCSLIDARDDQPIDRDERRAWYDTLRDLVPVIHGFKPTLRLYAEEMEWCALSLAAADLEKFRNRLSDRLPAKLA